MQTISEFELKSIRPEILHLAVAMEKKMKHREKKYQNGYKQAPPEFLREKLFEEYGEFLAELNDPASLPVDLLLEGVDLCNVVMMLLDILGALDHVCNIHFYGVKPGVVRSNETSDLPSDYVPE